MSVVLSSALIYLMDLYFKALKKIITSPSWRLYLVFTASWDVSQESTCLTLQFAHFLSVYSRSPAEASSPLLPFLLPFAICIERHLSSLAQLWQLAPSTSDLKDWQLWSLHPLFGLHGLISSWASTTSISLPEPPQPGGGEMQSFSLLFFLFVFALQNRLLSTRASQNRTV